ncbi:MAG: hypothetical protein WCJ86_01615 [Candidatus Saccharibacteria bacterium]
MHKIKNWRIFCWLLVLSGIGIIIFGNYYPSLYSAPSTYKSTTGLVIGVKKIYPIDDYTCRFDCNIVIMDSVEITFTVNQNRYKFNESVGVNKFPLNKLVKVSYNPENPGSKPVTTNNSVVIRDGKAIVILGKILCIPLIPLLLFNKRNKQSQESQSTSGYDTALLPNKLSTTNNTIINEVTVEPDEAPAPHSAIISADKLDSEEKKALIDMLNIAFTNWANKTKAAAMYWGIIALSATQALTFIDSLKLKNLKIHLIYSICTVLMIVFVYFIYAKKIIKRRTETLKNLDNILPVFMISGTLTVDTLYQTLKIDDYEVTGRDPELNITNAKIKINKYISYGAEFYDIVDDLQKSRATIEFIPSLSIVRSIKDEEGHGYNCITGAVF